MAKHRIDLNVEFKLLKIAAAGQQLGDDLAELCIGFDTPDGHVSIEPRDVTDAMIAAEATRIASIADPVARQTEIAECLRQYVEFADKARSAGTLLRDARQDLLAAEGVLSAFRRTGVEPPPGSDARRN